MFSNEGFLRALRGKTANSIKMTSTIVSRNEANLSLFVSDDAGVGGMVWEAAGALADFLRPECENKRFLELGSGTGMLGLCVALQKAAHVTLTDRFDVLPLLQASADANKLNNVTVLELGWGEKGQNVPEFDCLIASEVIYNGNLYDKLMHTILELLRGNPNKDVPMVMSFERRSSEDRWMEMVKSEFEHVELHKASGTEKDISILKCYVLKTK